MRVSTIATTFFLTFASVSTAVPINPGRVIHEDLNLVARQPEPKYTSIPSLFTRDILDTLYTSTHSKRSLEARNEDTAINLQKRRFFSEAFEKVKHLFRSTITFPTVVLTRPVRTAVCEQGTRHDNGVNSIGRGIRIATRKQQHLRAYDSESAQQLSYRDFLKTARTKIQSGVKSVFSDGGAPPQQQQQSSFASLPPVYPASPPPPASAGNKNNSANQPSLAPKCITHPSSNQSNRQKKQLNNQRDVQINNKAKKGGNEAPGRAMKKTPARKGAARPASEVSGSSGTHRRCTRE
ncbi:hypothetical protein AMATHDRAFT_6243 [Amanita thiersii Skay4041]|uniref:Uncharacterized protein n=1 Tax=Amanita thiersii Skay4041 TaxID=703135 RepID=A0A2A9NJU9_9AGAR|nr:hypothetical protein AMATHDRAFT_6243 [Amanita thiersii Skay4041]